MRRFAPAGRVGEVGYERYGQDEGQRELSSSREDPPRVAADAGPGDSCRSSSLRRGERLVRRRLELGRCPSLGGAAPEFTRPAVDARPAPPSGGGQARGLGRPARVRRTATGNVDRCRNAVDSGGDQRPRVRAELHRSGCIRSDVRMMHLCGPPSTSPRPFTVALAS